MHFRARAAGHLRKPQGRHRFVCIGGSAAACCDHCRLAVAAQGLAQQEREAARHVSKAAAERALLQPRHLLSLNGMCFLFGWLSACMQCPRQDRDLASVLHVHVHT